MHVRMRPILLSLSLSLSLSLTVPDSAEALPQEAAQPAAGLELLEHADVDGDGAATLADLLFLQWWLDKGGSLAALEQAAVPGADGIYSLRSFFDSPLAQLAGGVLPQPTTQTQSPASRSAEDEDPPVALLGSQEPCDFIEGQELPAYPETTVTSSNMNNLQAAIDLYQMSGSGDHRIRVLPGVYNSVQIDLGMLSGHLIIYADEGPGRTRIDGTNNTRSCIQITNPLLDCGGEYGVVGRLTIGWNLLDDLNDQPPFVTSPNCSTSLPIPGDVDALNRGWHGFDLCDGSDGPFALGGGISVISADCPVDVRGCYIHHPTQLLPVLLPDRGGGIGVQNASAPVSIILNQISNNRAKDVGAGVFVTQSSAVLVAKNWIFENSFANPSALAAPGAPLGGGVFGQDSGLALCRNQIYANSARRGCGVYFTYGSAPHTVFLVAQENDVHSHVTWISNPPITAPSAFGFLGGGFYIGQEHAPLPGSVRQLGLLRNRVHDNSVASSQPVVGSVNQQGGGLYIDVELADSPGPFQNTLAENFIIGNSIYRNTAVSQAAGMHLACYTSGLPLVFDNNTIHLNEITGGSVPGLYVGNVGVAVHWQARNNIIGGNLPLTARQWDATCVGTMSPFLHSHVTDEFPSGCPGGQDLFGDPAVTFNSTDNPLIHYPLPPDDNPHIAEASSASNSGLDPGWATGLFAFDQDIDDEPRIQATVIDRGADEANNFSFRRGDANQDGSINLSDVIRILCHLFDPSCSSGPFSPCPDQVDVNDDGSVNITDSVYLANYLFSAGPAPPAPFPNCGIDLTADGLGPCLSTGTSGCP